MSWHNDKIVVPVKPIVFTLAGNITVAVGNGIWKYLGPTETWEDYFIYQQNNSSGILWPEEEYKKKQSSDVVVHKVLSSNGKTHYNVVQVGSSFKCNCVGFSYRRNCRHCDEIKKKVG